MNIRPDDPDNLNCKCHNLPRTKPCPECRTDLMFLYEEVIDGGLLYMCDCGCVEDVKESNAIRLRGT